MRKHRIVSRAALWSASLLTMLLPRPVRQRWRRPALESLRETLVRETSLRAAALELISLVSWIAASWRTAFRDALVAISSPNLTDLLFDASSALRSLLRRPGYSLAALGLLSLGLGSATAIFSVLDPVLLRPLAYDPEARLFTVLREHAIAMFRFNSHTLEERDLLSNASALESLALYNRDTA
ncbi:MAG: hypothetical protein AAGK22_29375, partial [Acidobacteriota bacterium]